jgi:hypothetical protein
MNIKNNLIRTGRNPIAPVLLFALLLPTLIVTPVALQQGRPVAPPPRRDLPRGPLSPVMTIRVNSSYFLCNSLQLQSLRRVVWEPLLASLGASRTERDAYGVALDNAATEVCAGRLDSPLMNSAYRDLDRVMSGVEDRTFGRTMLTSDERIKLSSSLMQAAYDEFQSRCFDNRVKEAELMIGRLPKTPDVGLGVDALPASAALGRCGSGGKAPRTGIDVAFAQSQFQSCAAKVLRSISQDCNDPAGQDRASGTRRPPIEGDTDWQPTADGGHIRAFQENAPDGSYQLVYQKQNPDGSVLTHTEYYTPGSSRSHRGDYPYMEVFDVEQGGRTTTYSYDNPEARTAFPMTQPSDPAVRRRLEADYERIRVNRQRAWDEYNAAVEAALRHSPPPPTRTTTRLPSRRSDPTRQCQAMSVSASGGMGLLRPESTDGGEGTRSREWISGSDLVLSCLCAFGSKGAQLANQIATAMGEPGVSCSNNEWLRRVDCVENPRGPTDQIRPECLAYLQADYQFDTPRTACEAAIQCPEGSHVIVVGRPGSSGCRCSSDSTAGGPRPGFNCSLVRCPPPGSKSSNPAVQACCGTPDEGPGTPSDGPPTPPKPDPGGAKNSGDKKDGGGVGVPSSLILPRLLTVDELIGRAAVSGGNLQLVSLGVPKDPQAKVLEWSNVTSGDQLTLTFDSTTQASVNLYLSVMRGPQGGSLRVIVNGQELGTLADLNFQQQKAAKLPFGHVELRSGANTITLIAIPPHGASKMRVSLFSLALDK